MAKGIIISLKDRGFGFIKVEQGEDLFFHRNDVEGVGFNSLDKGQEVEFETEQGQEGRLKAVKVRLVEAQAGNDSEDEGVDGSGEGDG